MYKLLANAGKPYQERYNELTDLQLDSVIREIKETHPNAGETNVIGHLRARNIRVPRRRVRHSIHRVDPEGPSAKFHGISSQSL